MESRKIEMKVFDKKSGKWEETYSSDNAAEIYRALARNLTSKYLHKASYTKQVKDRCNYDGTRTITIYYDNGVKCEYTVEE